MAKGVEEFVASCPSPFGPNQQYKKKKKRRKIIVCAKFDVGQVSTMQECYRAFIFQLPNRIRTNLDKKG